MKTLTIIVPLYNEEGRIIHTFKALEQFIPPKTIQLQSICFVNDGSTDKTFGILERWHHKQKEKFTQKHTTIRIVSYPKNRGRGYAIRLGLPYAASTDYALYIDGDMSIPLDNLAKFAPFMEQSYDLLIGSKKKPGAITTIDRGCIRTLAGYIHSIVACCVLGVVRWDFQGGFKLFSHHFIQKIIPLTRQNRWGFDMEVIYFATRFKLSIVELPVTWGCSDEGSKVHLLRDSLRALGDMVAIRCRGIALFVAWQIKRKIFYQQQIRYAQTT